MPSSYAHTEKWINSKRGAARRVTDTGRSSFRNPRASAFPPLEATNGASLTLDQPQWKRFIFREAQVLLTRTCRTFRPPFPFSPLHHNAIHS